MAYVGMVWLIGLLLIYAEFYVPGGILALLGGMALVLSLWLGYECCPQGYFVIIWTLWLVASAYGTIQFALWRLKQSGEGTILSSDSQVGYVASSYRKDLIGKQALAISDLRPAGWIDLEGRRFPAMSESGWIPKGDLVLIISGEGSNFIVRALH